MEDPFIKSIAKIDAEDSSRAIVTFTTDNGAVTYQFSIFDLQTIVGAMSQMVLFARSQTQSMGYHFVTPVLDLADATAEPASDKNKIVLSVKLQNGIVCEFGLEPSVANRLREDMWKGLRRRCRIGHRTPSIKPLANNFVSWQLAHFTTIATALSLASD